MNMIPALLPSSFLAIISDMKQCEICEVQEVACNPDSAGTAQGKLITIRGRTFCQSCILLGLNALRHWHGVLENDDSPCIEIEGNTFCESHILKGVDTLKEDLEAFLSRIPNEHR